MVLSVCKHFTLFRRKHCVSWRPNSTTCSTPNCIPVGWKAWPQFCCKMWGDSLVWNQYSHRVDAEVNFYKYRFPILLLLRGVSKATLITLCFILQVIYKWIYLNFLRDTVLWLSNMISTPNFDKRATWSHITTSVVTSKSHELGKVMSTFKISQQFNADTKTYLRFNRNQNAQRWIGKKVAYQVSPALTRKECPAKLGVTYL